MNKILYIFVLLTLFFLGCKKLKVAPPTYDETDRVFRVIINSDVKYSVSVVEVYTDGAVVDTLASVSGLSTSELNFGFTPKIGSTIMVNSGATNAKSLNCTIAYKGIRLGLDSVTVVSNGLKAHFEYNVLN